MNFDEFAERVKSGWIPSTEDLIEIADRGRMIESRLATCSRLLQLGVRHMPGCPKEVCRRGHCDCGLDWVRQSLGLPKTRMRAPAYKPHCRACGSAFDIEDLNDDGRCEKCESAWRKIHSIRTRAKQLCSTVECKAAIEV